MKKIWILSVAAELFSVLALNAQSVGYITDAIRMYDNYYTGTARSLGVGNAFSSLGGDMGAIAINPASIGVYQSSEFSFSPGLLSFNNQSTYYGTKTKDNNYDFNFPSIGLVLSPKLSSSSDWKGFNLYFGYNKVNNLNNCYTIKGIATSSLMDEFVYYANGKEYYNLDSYFEQQAFNLAVIDTIPGKPTSYYSPYQNIPLLQRRTIETNGSIGEYSFGIGANYNHTLYFGLTFNIRSGYYEDIYHHQETDMDNAITDSYYMFNYKLQTNVSGFNAKIGLIFRPVEPLRLSVSIHTPTVLKLTQEMYTSMSVVDDNDNYYEEYPRDSQGYRIGKLEDNYRVTTPFRTVFGASFMFGEVGLISVDYELADYSKIKLSNADFSDIAAQTNDDIKDRLRMTNNIRGGVEFKLSSLYIRGGIAYYQSPYKSNQLNKDANTFVYSCGLGYRSGNFFIDLTYSLTQRSEKYYLYEAENLLPAKLNTSVGNYLLTMGFRF
jgi:hypothetical protein